MATLQARDIKPNEVCREPTFTHRARFKNTATLALALGLATVASGAIAAAHDGQGIPFQKAEAPVTGSVAITHTGGKTNLLFSKDFSTNPKAPAL